MVDQWNIEIRAHDISQRVLKMAEHGVYSDYSMRLTSEPIKNRYFVQSEVGYTVKDDVKKLVKFEHMNLKDNVRMRMISDMDIVFCRNVIIYFDDAMKKSVIGHLHRALNPGGYLFLGHSESLSTITNEFETIHLPGTMVYKKPNGQ